MIQKILSPHIWDGLRFYGMLSGITAVAFLMRSWATQIVVRICTLNKPSRLSKQLLVTFAAPLEFVFVAMVALITIKALPDRMQFSHLHNTFWTMILLCVFWALFRATNTYSGKLQKVYDAFDTHLSKELSKLITNVLKALVMLVCVFTILDLWGVNVAALLGGVGIISAAVAFASQDTIKNIFGSVAVLMDHTFAIGDRIAIDAIEGNVEDIGLRSTLIRRSDQALIMIPNGNIVNVPVINFSRIAHRMVQFSIPFVFESDPQSIRAFIQDMRQFIQHYKWYHSMVNTAPILVFVDHMHQEGMVITVRFFIRQTDYESMCIAKQDAILEARSLAENHHLEFYQFSMR